MQNKYIVNDYTKLAMSCRRLKFEFGKVMGVMWFIKRIGWEIKEPFRTMYNRSIKKAKGMI